MFAVTDEIYFNCLYTCMMGNNSFSNPDFERCCIIECCFGRLGILQNVINADKSVQIQPVPQNIFNAFMIARERFNESTAWLSVVNMSVELCYNQVSPTNQFDCDNAIPTYVYSIIDCTYLQNFLRCPSWNQNDPECATTYKYAQNCMSNEYELEMVYDGEPVYFNGSIF